MGTGYKGNSLTFRSIRENVSRTKMLFSFSDGLFGDKGKSRDSFIRNITADDPAAAAKEFYDLIAYGGIESVLLDKKTGYTKGMITKMADGSVIAWREISVSDGSPAVDINIERSSDKNVVRQQKIHFVKGKQHEDN